MEVDVRRETEWNKNVTLHYEHIPTVSLLLLLLLLLLLGGIPVADISAVAPL